MSPKEYLLDVFEYKRSFIEQNIRLGISDFKNANKNG